MFPRSLIVLSVALLSTLGAGCAISSTSSDSRLDQDAELLLDFAPNAVPRASTSPCSAAMTRRRASISTSRRPARPARPARLAQHHVAIARAKGKDVVGVMALVQTPLAARDQRA
jgi:hypothetical protein